MINSVISDLNRYRENIAEEFKAWCNLVTAMTQSVVVQPSVPRLPKGWWSRFKCNDLNDIPKSYYKNTVTLPFLDDINSPLPDKLQDGNHLDIFALLPSAMSSNINNIDEATEFFFQGYKNEMVNEGVNFSLEVRRWFNLWNNNSYQKKQKNNTTQTAVDGKSAYIVENLPDSFADVLKVANRGNLLLIGAHVPVSF